MLIDFVVRNKDEDAAHVAKVLAESGVDLVVFDRDDEPLQKAIEVEGLHGLAAVALRDESAVLLAFGTEMPQQRIESVAQWNELNTAFAGVVAINHPYDRRSGRPWGDRVYRVKGLTHISAFLRDAEPARNQLASAAAQKLSAGSIYGSWASVALRGKTATFLNTDGPKTSAVVEAMLQQRTLGCHMQSIGEVYSPLSDPPRENTHEPRARASRSQDSERPRRSGRNDRRR